ncbi:putative ATP-dependent RNA helicase DHX30 [Ctenocephalides felis]|uniref:putative ATP-dependent RNA helicase DHX30 n=1 Tax=Ctenocephalides felis TaxID=7515 RepID=UPI000E6E4F38|nr:putative ATP-dependent RNA helicase DHX30 [Ctenocephalides felis]
MKSVLKLNISCFGTGQTNLKHLTNCCFHRISLLEICRNSASGSTSVLSRHYSFQNSSKIRKFEMPNHNRKPEMEEIKLNNVSSAEWKNAKRLGSSSLELLHNIAMKVKTHTKKDMMQDISFTRGEDIWYCSRVIYWPTELKFVGKGSNKKIAAQNCAKNILSYLLISKKINSKYEPILYTKNELKELLTTKLVDITLPSNLIGEVRELNQLFDDQIVPILRDNNQFSKRDPDFGYETSSNQSGDSLPHSHKNISYTRIQRRNAVLTERAEKILNNEHSARKKFPIFNYREQLLDLLEFNQVVVIKGEPGCGKSTQVPQYIMEEASINGFGNECNILITQPRRISAISLARRIAEERNERLGDVVGYQVRLNSITPDNTGGNILFCTTGIALKKIQYDPLLQAYSHLIIDEAHERDADIDTLLLLVKYSMKQNPNLKVIVMSATMNAELFRNYFNNGAILTIPGFTYPVTMNFLDDMKKLPMLKKYFKCTNEERPLIFEEEVAGLINWIHKNRPSGAILCFLPGWQEIMMVREHLEDLNNSSLQILVAHSKVSTEMQNKIFHVPPLNVRKVILSTNICETSITINDVSYVVDCGVHKNRNVLPSGLQSLEVDWISQASVKQRQGRAGRVKSGESFHLFTKKRYDALDPHTLPEILRMPLQKVILDSKTYHYGQTAQEFLSQLIEPPPESRIEQAVNELIGMSALDEDENLTPLGKRIAWFSLPPKLSKALIHASIFKCFDPILTISTMYSTDGEAGVSDTREDNRFLKAQYDKLSDHVAVVKIYNDWKNCRESSSMKFNEKIMKQTEQLRELHAENVYACGILNKSDDYRLENSECNEFANNDELMKAILFSGVASICEYHTHKIVKGLPKRSPHFSNVSQQILQITCQSVLYDRTSFPSPFLCYISELHSVERRRSLVSEASVLSPLALMLFNESGIACDFEDTNGNRASDECHKTITIVDHDVKLKCHDEQIEDLVKLRLVIFDTLQYFIINQGKADLDHERHNEMCNFRDNVVSLVIKLLNRMKYCS